MSASNSKSVVNRKSLFGGMVAKVVDVIDEVETGTAELKRICEWYKKFEPKHSKKLEVLQWNDAYNVDEKEDDAKAAFNPDVMVMKAGVARFKNALDVYGGKDKLVAFSGDLFFPSRMSTLFEGE